MKVPLLYAFLHLTCLWRLLKKCLFSSTSGQLGADADKSWRLINSIPRSSESIIFIVAIFRNFMVGQLQELMFFVFPSKLASHRHSRCQHFFSKLACGFIGSINNSTSLQIRTMVLRLLINWHPAVCVSEHVWTCLKSLTVFWGESCTRINYIQ